MKLIFSLALYFILNNLFSQTIHKILIDPVNAHGGTVSQYFNNFRFIPLETTKESLFGKIDQLEVTKNNFIILDLQTKSILFFKKNGKFDFKLTPHGSDHFFGYFTIDRQKHQLLVISKSNAISIYDLKGTFLKKVVLPENISSITWLNDDNILFMLTQPIDPVSPGKIMYNIAYSSNFLKNANYAIPYHSIYGLTELNQYMNPLNKSDNPASVFFSLPGDYNLYQLNDGNNIQHYKFIFPINYSLPYNFSEDSAYAGKRAQYLYRNSESNGKIESIENVFKLDNNLLLFSVRQTGYLTIDRTYLFNSKTSNLISFGKIVGDSLSNFIPFGNARYGEMMVVYKDNFLYSSIPAITMFNFKEKNKLIHFSPALDVFFAHGDKKSNPILIEAKLSKSF